MFRPHLKLRRWADSFALWLKYDAQSSLVNEELKLNRKNLLFPTVCLCAITFGYAMALTDLYLSCRVWAWLVARRRPVTSTRAVSVSSKLMGSLPIINELIEALELKVLFDRFVPGDSRSKLDPSIGLGVLLRNLLVSREPLYSLPEWCRGCDETLLGVPIREETSLNDDRLGRCLDKLFAADRAALMTEIIVRAVRKFGLVLDELHNDSTTVTFEGEYRGAKGQPKNGRATVRFAHGHNKDHRPDLKQLLYILTTTADGAVPVWSAVTHGNRTDDKTHIDTWEALRQLVGKTEFTYVADSKLCTRENMEHIDRRGGRFITVLPRTRREIQSFVEWRTKHEVPWQELLRQPSVRAKDDPDSVYWGFEWPQHSGEGHRLIWIKSSQKALLDLVCRQRRLARASDELNNLSQRLSSPKSRIKDAEVAREAAAAILAATQTEGLINWAIESVELESFKQAGPGRPTPETAYVRITKPSLKLHWSHDAHGLKAAAEMDGIFPLITNDFRVPMAEVLASYKHQPALERRHEQMKTVLEVMPMFLKSATRIEALLFLYFLAQLVHALIERRLRKRMAKEGLSELPMYPEERTSKRPTADQVFRLFDGVRCHRLHGESGATMNTFVDDLTKRQSLILRLLDISPAAYSADSRAP